MNLDVTPEEAQLILTGLAELPAKMSFNLIAKLVPQVQLQQEKQLVKVPPVAPTQPGQQQD